MSILTIFILPLVAFTSASRAGPKVLQGPHHGAQKSTTMGELFDASITSSMKVSSFTSFTWISSAFGWLSSNMNHLLNFAPD